MKLLDLFCGAGGAAVGYHRAGFSEIVGVDIVNQPNYPFHFIRGDALEYLAAHGHEFDVIHASPPCQFYSVTKHLSNGNHPDLVPQTRIGLIATGKPYIIENVPGAPLINPLILCGTMFNLRVIRHRLFECNPELWFPPICCKHDGLATGGRERRRGNTKTPKISDGYKFVTVVGNNYLADEGRIAMGIDWTTKKELSQTIPPAYTQYIGEQLIEAMRKGKL